MSVPLIVPPDHPRYADVLALVGLAPATPHPTVPGILSFAADPPSVAAGETVAVSWQTRNADRVTLRRESADGAVALDPVAVAGSLTHAPNADTTYILTAESGPFAKIATAVVTVTPPEPPAPPDWKHGPVSSPTNS